MDLNHFDIARVFLKGNGLNRMRRTNTVDNAVDAMKGKENSGDKILASN